MMFTTTSHRSRAGSRAPRARGAATLRIYNAADWPMGAIYEEIVVGGYREMPSNRLCVIASAGDGKPNQVFTINTRTKYVRHLGAIEKDLNAAFDEVEDGETFYRRGRFIRMTKEEIRAVVFKTPVWYAERVDTPSPTTPAPAISSSAKMRHMSICDEQADNVDLIVLSDKPEPVMEEEETNAPKL